MWLLLEPDKSCLILCQSCSRSHWSYSRLCWSWSRLNIYHHHLKYRHHHAAIGYDWCSFPVWRPPTPPQVKYVSRQSIFSWTNNFWNNLPDKLLEVSAVWWLKYSFFEIYSFSAFVSIIPSWQLCSIKLLFGLDSFLLRSLHFFDHFCFSQVVPICKGVSRCAPLSSPVLSYSFLLCNTEFPAC